MSDTRDSLAHVDCSSRLRPTAKKPRRPASRTRGRQTIAESKPETEQRQPGREDYTLADDKHRTETQGVSNNPLLLQKPQEEVSRLPWYFWLHPVHSDRPVDARGQIAALITGGTKLRPDYSDNWVRKAVRYLRARQSCRTDDDRELLIRKMPDLHAAYDLHECGDKLARGTLEARFLAGQTIEEIAAACGLTPEAVTAYHALFFDVMDKLKARIYILIHAIGMKYFPEPSEEDVDAILKWAAFVKGPIILEMFLRYYRTPLVLPNKLGDLTREQLDALYEWLLTRALIKVWALPPAKILRIRLYHRLLDQLRNLIDTWPEPIKDGSQPGPVDNSSLTANRETWWSVWRQAVETAATAQGIDDLPEETLLPGCLASPEAGI